MVTEKRRNKYIRRFVFFVLWWSIAAGFAFALLPPAFWPANFNSKFFSLVFFLSAFWIILPVLLFRVSDPLRQEGVMILRFGLAFSIFSGQIGSVFLYRFDFIYNIILHFILPFILTAAAVRFWQNWAGWPRKKAVAVAALAVIAGSILWELSEYLSDLIFQTTAFGIDGRYPILDTIFDLGSDWLGVLIAVKAMSSRKFFQAIAGNPDSDHFSGTGSILQ